MALQSPGQRFLRRENFDFEALRLRDRPARQFRPADAW